MKLTVEEMAKLRGMIDGSYGIPNSKKVLLHIDAIERELTEANQSNLMLLEGEKELKRQLNSIEEYARKISETNRVLRDDNDLLYKDFAKERTNKELLAVALERTMLDHQPVALPKEVAAAIDDFKSDGHDIDYIIRCLSSRKGGTPISRLQVLLDFASKHGYELISALVNDYTVEVELTLPIVEELADMIQKWTNEPTFEDEDAECLALATMIVERTKEFYSKN